MPGHYVTIEFEDFSPYTTDYYHRSITLSAPNWEASIGRSTSSSQGLKEAADNALFSSRVVSREHAKLRADPETRLVTIEDTGSMHGTHVGGRRLQPHQPEPIYDGSTVIFGAEVERIERGSSTTFKPKKVQIYFNWSAEAYGYDENPVLPTPVNQESRNSFTADYSSDEPATPYDSGEDEEPHPLSVAEAAKAFTVPDESSDISDEIISIISDDDASDVQSPTSSPVGSVDLAEKPIVIYADSSNALPIGSSHCHRETIDISEDDSYYEDSSIFEGGEDEEEDGEHARSRAQQRSKVTVNIPEIRPREPSPSDAAMVKPATTPKSPPFSQHLPSITAFQPSNYDATFTTSSFSNSGRNEGAWAGHNSVLYEPVPVSQSSAPPRILDHYYAPLPSDRALSSPAIKDDSLFLMPSKLACSSYEPAATDTNTNYNASLYHSAPEVVFTEDVINEIPELADCSPSEIMVEQVSHKEEHSSTTQATLAAINAETSHQLKAHRKRKADEMSVDKPTINEKGIDALTSLIENKEAAAKTSSMRVIATNKTKLVDSITSLPAANISAEPPKKKTKTSTDDSCAPTVKTGSNFGQLAATAMVSVATGVAIGAVGAVFGLASLPADFFT